MATVDSTASRYKFRGQSTPLHQITQDRQLLKIASTLHDQAVEMDKAQLNGKPFAYRSIPIPAKYRRIFGG